jgi:hypothetical protein
MACERLTADNAAGTVLVQEDRVLSATLQELARCRPSRSTATPSKNTLL